MDKLEKVTECYNNAEIYECPRCNQHYCDNCNPPETVEFDITEKDEKYFTIDRNWVQEKVCPYCYNQLIDKCQKPTEKRHGGKQNGNEFKTNNK